MMPGRVEQRTDGWYNVDADKRIPLIWDIWGAGGFGYAALPAQIRALLRRIADLERRGP